MSDHPIQGLMETAMENIKAMVDVNTIVGDAVETPDGTVILPISKVGFGFAAVVVIFTSMEKVMAKVVPRGLLLNMPVQQKWLLHLVAVAAAVYPYVLLRSWW